MTTQVGGFVMVMLAMSGVAAVVLALAGAWLGYRALRRGAWRRSLWLGSGLALLNAWWAVQAILQGAPFPDDAWSWLLVVIGLPLMAGHALGVMAGLLRGRASH